MENPGTRDLDRPGDGGGEFGRLVRYTAVGYVGGLVAAVLLDRAALGRSALGQWLVRTLSGEGESLFEGAFALRQRLRRAPSSMAEAYGWGKLAGMAAPWAVDWASRTLGVDVYGVAGFYIPYLYALSDQIGANLAGFVYLRREAGTTRLALQRYRRDPVMMTSLAVIVLVPLGLFLARLAGFSPTTQLRTAFETIAANLCWVPPLVGWLAERRRTGERERGV